ncbi:MAG: LCP family protein [Chloroflexi bacterium]|nr:LCP family protein [Chloroflexota bacterium]
MQQFDNGAGSATPTKRGGFNPKVALTTFAFCTFVLGGFAFGWLFLVNFKMLAVVQQARVSLLAPPMIALPPGLTSAPAPVPVPRRPGERVTVPPVAAPAGTPVATEIEPEQAPDLSNVQGWGGTKRVNILLIGIDHRDDEPIEGSRSDTIMVVSIDPLSKSVVMISLPRDLYVTIPGQYQQRINVAHAVGGPQLLAQTIQANFGIQIDNFARVDFSGFEQVVDAVGGVIIDVERPVKDDEYPTEDYGVMRLYIPPGPVLMDGRTALMYARSRHSESDFGRSKRQQRVLLALRERASTMNIVPKITTLLQIANKAIATDLSAGEMVALGRLGIEIQRDRMKTLVVDENLASPFLGPNGENLLMPSRQAIQSAILRAFSEAAGQTARVEVLNGSNQVGVARQVADQLARAGYDVLKVDDAERNDYVGTTIEVLTNNQPAAKVLATRLRVPESSIKLVPTPNSSAELRVIVGRP